MSCIVKGPFSRLMPPFSHNLIAPFIITMLALKWDKQPTNMQVFVIYSILQAFATQPPLISDPSKFDDVHLDTQFAIIHL